jgi:ABC-type glycerol-3-phosphate transport system substrate-binding protein
MVDLFLDDTVFSCFIWTDDCYRMLDRGNEVPSVRPGFSTIPRKKGLSPKTQMTAWNFFLPTQSRRHEHAKEFVRWFLRRERQRQYLLQGGAPCLQTAFDDINRDDWLPYFQPMKESYDCAVPKETFPEAEEIRMELSSMLHDLLLKKALGKRVNIQEQLEKAKQSIEKILSRGTAYWSC